eukprot:TRINITY_DN4996_c0_g2_i1.p1 TRINITY_DN4996_c0_g2~~TRINITY_DN4996_c0_g2_i1.p1  ORF type:complete len:245 (-),score=38.18 TRINITY_DN4996_c0_g2_i1:69-803(-)
MCLFATFVLCLFCSSLSYPLDSTDSEGKCLVQRASNAKTAKGKSSSTPDLNEDVPLSAGFPDVDNKALGFRRNNDVRHAPSMPNIVYDPDINASKIPIDKDASKVGRESALNSIVREGLPNVQNDAPNGGVLDSDRDASGKGKVSLLQSGGWAVPDLWPEFEDFLAMKEADAEAQAKLAPLQSRWKFTGVLFGILFLQLVIAIIYFGFSPSDALESAVKGEGISLRGHKEDKKHEQRRWLRGCC